MSGAFALSLATEGLTLGAAARPFAVGAAGTSYSPNPVVETMLLAAQTVPPPDAPEGRSMDREVVAGVSAIGPQTWN